MKKFARKISIFCVLLTIQLVFASFVYACSCVPSGTVDLELEQSSYVAVFKLRSVEKLAEGEVGFGYGGIKNVKLTVEKVFKGNLKIGQELVFAQGGGSDCGFAFSETNIGMDYLLYLKAKADKDNLWRVSFCSRSKTLKAAAADLLYIEKLEKVKNKTRLSGKVTQIIRAAVEGEELSYDHLAGKKIRITGNGKNIELKTDENGVYEIYDLPVGKYKITPEKITGYKVFGYEGNFVEVEIKDKSHTEQDFYFSINNAISGKFFDADGKPLEDVCLELLPARGKKAKTFYQTDGKNKVTTRVPTDEKGRFTIQILKGQKGRLFGSITAYEKRYKNCPEFDKVVRESGNGLGELQTRSIQIEATGDLSGIKLKFPFSNCGKTQID